MENEQIERNERDERKGNGIFLGIVAVATLIVAIIGASFAYFSAQAASANNAVDITGYEFNASLVMEDVFVPNKAFIPFNPDTVIPNSDEPNTTNILYALNVYENKCEDKDHGLAVCALYKVTVTNGSSAPLTLNGSIVTTANNASERGGTAEPFSNLQFRDVTKEGSRYVAGNTAVDLGDNAGDSAQIYQGITVPANSSVEKYVLIYLNEIDDDQSVEMGASYQGQIVFAASGNNTNRLTGTFTIGS